MPEAFPMGSNSGLCAHALVCVCWQSNEPKFNCEDVVLQFYRSGHVRVVDAEGAWAMQRAED